MIAKLATVSSVSGYELTVIPDGSTTPITAIDCCGAQVSDRVICELHATQMLAVAIVGGPHIPPAPIVYMIESGIIDGWHYQLYSNGYLIAWCEVPVSCATSGVQTSNHVNLPKVMADTSYTVTTGNTLWRIGAVWEIRAARTTSTIQLGFNVTSAASETAYLQVALFGEVTV